MVHIADLRTVFKLGKKSVMIRVFFVVVMTSMFSSAALADQVPFEEELRNLVGFCVVSESDDKAAVASIERKGYVNQSELKLTTGLFDKKIGDTYFTAQIFNRQDNPGGPHCVARIFYADSSNGKRLIGAASAYLIFAKFVRDPPIGQRTIFKRNKARVGLKSNSPNAEKGEFTLGLTVYE